MSETNSPSSPHGNRPGTAESSVDALPSASGLGHLLGSLAPRSVLCVGEPVEQLLTTMSGAFDEVSLSNLPLSEIPEKLNKLPVYDLAYVQGAIERLPRAAGGMLLARLRDVSSRHLIVHVEIGTGWPDHTSDWTSTDLLAFGLTLVDARMAAELRTHLYQYNIADYKLIPDWFNSDRWAHPHLWEA